MVSVEKISIIDYALGQELDLLTWCSMFDMINDFLLYSKGSICEELQIVCAGNATWKPFVISCDPATFVMHKKPVGRFI